MDKKQVISMGIAIYTFYYTFFLFSTIASSQFTTQTCFDNSTLLVNETDLRCIDGICKDFTKTRFETCSFGCDAVTNTCNPNPFMQNLIFIGFFLGLTILMVFFVRAIR